MIVYYVQHSPIAPAITGGVPDTQQVGHYTTTYGEHADFAINPQSFNNTGPESLEDDICIIDEIKKNL